VNRCAEIQAHIVLAQQAGELYARYAVSSARRRIFRSFIVTRTLLLVSSRVTFFNPTNLHPSHFDVVAFFEILDAVKQRL
jgi:hypothetical protein